jgi:molybdenum cofactor biosynthesis enzyme MoaA
MAGALRQAGLDRVNISLDSLQEERYQEIHERRRTAPCLGCRKRIGESGTVSSQDQYGARSRGQ